MSAFVSIIIKGGIVMIPLLACSLISLALTIERILFWTKLKSKEVLQQILSLVENGEFEQALNLGNSSDQPIARVLAAGIAHRNPAPAKAMEAKARALVAYGDESPALNRIKFTGDRASENLRSPRRIAT